MFFDKTRYLFFTHVLIGIAIILLTKSTADNFALNNGKELISFFVSLPASISFMIISIWKKPLDRKTFIYTVVLFLILTLPLANILPQTYAYLPQDDGYKYSLAAKNIVVAKTLWASDGLTFKTSEKGYILQPGYRYFIAAWIFLFRAETRAFQFASMFLYLTSILLFVYKFSRIDLPVHIKNGIYIFLIISSLFVVKLILLGLAEWLVVAGFMTFFFLFFSRQYGISVTILALLPFLRQSLLPFICLLFFWSFVNKQHFRQYIIVFVLVVLLPVYHNLYYAKSLTFFSSYSDISWFSPYSFEGSFSVRIFKIFLYHLTLYLGIDWWLSNLWANLLAVSFIPLGTYLFIKSVLHLKTKSRTYYIAATFSMILPTLIYGWGYYPRFEWLNITLALLTFPLMVANSNTRSHTGSLVPLN